MSKRTATKIRGGIAELDWTNAERVPVDKIHWTPGQPGIAWRDLCRTYEAKGVRGAFSSWGKTLERCAIFDLSNLSSEELRESASDLSEDATDPENWLGPLPFPEIAIVHGWTILVIREFWVEHEKERFGAELLTLSRPFQETPGFLLMDQGTIIHDNSEGHTPEELVDVRVDGPDIEEGFTEALLQLEDFKHLDILDYKIAPDIPRDEPESGTALQGLFWNMVQALIYLHGPEQYIVESTPRKKGKTKKGQIPRAHTRPSYIILNKSGVKKRYLDSQPSGRKSPMPHLRRGHYRTLTNKRYKEPGKRVWVRATSINGNTVEWREGDRSYRVI